MNPKLLANLAAVLFVVWVAIGKPGIDSVVPDVEPDLPPLVVPADAPQLDAIFAAAVDKTKAEQDLEYLVAFMARLALYIERDGMAPEPRLKHGANVQDMRGQMRHDLFDGQSLANRYPGFGPAVGAYLDSRVGTTPVDLTSEVRRQWVEAFRGVGAACERARRALK